MTLLRLSLLASSGFLFQHFIREGTFLTCFGKGFLPSLHSLTGCAFLSCYFLIILDACVIEKENGLSMSNFYWLLCMFATEGSTLEESLGELLLSRISFSFSLS